ncbi:MAG TPA: DUF917 domain-containing protein [Steroidobacteraceae bacterium]|nr:DUF917 domain-containing protein [Steroidobacteraceae bacterium]
MRRILTAADVEFAVKGGSVLACGGGGWPEHGRELGTLAVTIGRPELVTLDEVADDAWIATAAAIGAPGGLTDWQMLGMDYVTAARLLQEALGAPLYGLIIGQNGMSSTVNAWLPAAVLGLKVIDAVGDVRAHPTGDMGSIGLAGRPESTIQTAAGGNRARNAYIEATLRGPTAKVSPVVRAAADASGGFIASCRNPIAASYVREHAALGGISLALGLGSAIADAEARGPAAVLDAITERLKGDVIFTGRVVAKTLQYTSSAFDVGQITLDCGRRAVLHVMNEYMAVESQGERLATYPDVITTFTADAAPISAGRIEVGMELHVLRVAKQHLPLSASITDPSVYPIVERTLGINISDYALAAR